MSRATLAQVAVTVVLSVLTLAFFAWDGRFAVIDGNVIPNLDFSRGSEGWVATPGATLLPELGPAVALVTQPQRPLTYVSRDVRDPLRFAFLRLVAEVRLENIVPRALDWQRAGIVLRPFDRLDQRVRYWPYVMFEHDGSADWQRVSEVFPVSPDTGRLTLYVYNAGASGRFLVRGLKLEAVAESPATDLVHHALIVCWAGLVLSAAMALFARTGVWSRWLLMLLGALILASTLAPQPGLIYLVGDWANQAFGVVDATVERFERGPPVLADARRPPLVSAPGDEADPQLTSPQTAPAGEAGGTAGTTATAPAPRAEPGTVPPRATAPPAGVDAGTAAPPRPAPTASLKHWLDGILYEGQPVLGMDKQNLAHLTMFFVFAGVLALSLTGVAVPVMIVCLLLCASSSEVMQSFVISRSVELGDFIMDSIGILAGLALGLAIRRWRRRRNRMPIRPRP